MIRVWAHRTGARKGPAMINPGAVCDFLRHLQDADRESFYAIHLDTRNRVIGAEEIARGTLTDVGVHPREMFKGAILGNAAAVIVAHNHPSGDAAPSAQDIELTRRLIAAGKLIGIPVLDHVVVAADECVGLRDRHRGMGFGAVSMRRA